MKIDLFLIAGVTGLLGMPTGWAQNTWDTYARHYVATILGDLTTTAGDTTGRLLVTGNAALNGGYSVQMTQPGGGPQDPVDLSQDSLVVGGTLSVDPATGWVTVWNNWAYDNMGAGNVGSWNGGSGRAVPGLELDPATGNAVSSGGDSLAQIIAGMQHDSLYFSHLAERGVVSKEFLSWKATLTGNNSDLNIFTLTAAEASTWLSVSTRIIDAPAGSTVLINVPGSSITYTGGTLDLNGPDPNTVVFNYYEAATFSGGSFTHNGAVLAPFTTAANVGQNNAALLINGSAVLGGAVYQQNGSEFHNYPFQGILIPEPPAYAGASGLGLLGWLIWRRTRKTARQMDG